MLNILAQEHFIKIHTAFQSKAVSSGKCMKLVYAEFLCPLDTLCSKTGRNVKCQPFLMYADWSSQSPLLGKTYDTSLDIDIQ